MGTGRLWRGMCRAALWACVAVAGQGSGAEGADRPFRSSLQVEFETSWMLPYGPEVQVLLHNPSDQPIEINVTFAGAQCTPPAPPPHSRYWPHYGSAQFLGMELVGSSIALIAPHSWTHRTLPLWWTDEGKNALPDHCEVRVRFLDEWNGGLMYQTARIDVPWLLERSVEDNSIELADAAKLEVETSVDLLELQSAVIRVLVRNPGKRAVDVRTKRRYLHCAKPEDATWTLRYGPTDGLATGLQRVWPGRWVMFVHALDAARPLEEIDCRAVIELGLEKYADGVEVFRRVEVPVKVQGQILPDIME